MSYINKVGNMSIYVDCVSDPETTYAIYRNEIEAEIKKSGYKPETSMENLIKMVIIHFDCDDNYGEFDEETGCGGYGDEFTMSGLLDYVSDGGGWCEFDYDC